MDLENKLVEVVQSALRALYGTEISTETIQLQKTKKDEFLIKYSQKKRNNIFASLRRNSTRIEVLESKKK